ncbi:hypothetical protein FWF89_01855 [Candidatus Saccharibacteria bacterium]|nr:hypothetical protein [Candidatus Saccharibacteria bacterium]
MISERKRGGVSKAATVSVLGAAVIIGGAVWMAPVFADAYDDHEVNLVAEDEIILGGTVNTNVTLNPTISAIDSKSAAMSIKSTVTWKLQWQAVTGNLGATSIVGAGGTNLGTSGFTGGGGYTYAGPQTTASAGDQWGAVLAASGGSLAPTPTLTTSLSTVAMGSPTVVATVTPTYSASTSGALGMTSYYGTIYYVLSNNAAP